MKKYILMSFIVSGAIAGLGGSAELLGTQFRLINGFGNGYGFDGVAMALIGQLHPLATIVVATFFAALRVGSTTMQAATGVPTQRIRHHPGPGDRVHRGGSGHGEAARIQGVPGKADGETEGGGLIWNLS